MAEEGTNTQVQGQETAPVQFDYDKLASIIEGKQKVTEDSVLRGYFKEQGLTGDEMKSAVEMFKQDRASRQPDIGALNQQIEDANNAAADAESRALYAETQLMAMQIASELGVEQKTIPYLMKMADLTDVITDGQPDQDKLKESLGNVLKDIPQLKVSAENTPNGFKIGAGPDDSKKGSNEELARIFGVPKKG